MPKTKQEKELESDDFLDVLDALEESPINPEDRSGKSYTTKGWQYYLKVRELLPEWWEEFNGKIAASGKLVYGSTLSFIKSKTKNKQERKYLFWMIGPKPSTEDVDSHGKYEVPWLGDWYLRRKNGYWAEDNKLPIKALRKALKNNEEARETIKASAPFLIQDLMRLNKRISQLDDLFGGNPFINQEAPNSKGNIKRFKTYLAMYKMLWKEKVKAVHEIMRVMGINPQRPNEMWGMGQLAGVAGQIGASAALTGAAAVNGGLMIQGTSGGPGIHISETALLMASHIEHHAKSFELPYKIDGKDVSQPDIIEEKQKKNGKAHVV